jgi:hypothetical protein
VGELFTFARAREGRDEFEVERVIDAAAARTALGSEGTQAALAAAAAREFDDEPLPEEAAARARRESERRERAARGAAAPLQAALDEPMPEAIVRRARLKAEKLAAEAERTMGGELSLADVAEQDAEEARRQRRGTQDPAGA